MSFGRNLLSLVVLGFAVTGFSTFAAAQTEGTKDDGDRPKIEGQKRDKERYRRRGGRGFRGGKEFRGMHARGSLIRGLRHLELSEGQKAQVKSILEAHKTGQQPYREEMRSLGRKSRDGTATEDERARMQELKTQSRAASDQLQNSILSVLTPAQLQQLEQRKAERQQRKEERRRLWMERRQQRQTESPAKTDN